MRSLKIISFIFVLVLILLLCGCSALSNNKAETNQSMQQSETKDTISVGTETKTEEKEDESSHEKEELVYVNLSPDGSVKEVNVINVVYSEDGKFLDYGDYTEVTGISGTEHFYYSDGVISGNGDENRAVYMGSMPDTMLPWMVNIEYFLNGQKVSADDLAGKNGELKISIAIDKNNGCPAEYFDDYLVSLIMLLDEDVFSYVNVKNASVSGIADKQIITAYSVPGSEQYIEINADVRDFHMPEIELSAMKPDVYDMQIDDSEIRKEIDRIADLKADITEESDYGIANLNLGDISSKISEFSNKADDLCVNADEFSNELAKLKDNTNRVMNSTYQVEDSAAQLYNAASRLEEGIAGLDDILNRIEEIVDRYKSDIPEELLNQIEAVLDMVLEFIDNTSSLSDGTMQLLDGSIELHEATAELNDSIAEVEVGEFSDKLHDAKDKILEIKEQTDKITRDVDDMKTRVNEKIGQYDEKISDAKSKIDDISKSINREIERITANDNPEGDLSFASDKNGRIGRVLFRMRTYAIGE